MNINRCIFQFGLIVELICTCGRLASETGCIHYRFGVFNTTIGRLIIRIFIPLIRIIDIEGTGQHTFINILNNGDGGLFIDLYFCARQQSRVLGKVHQTGKQVDLHVTCDWQHKITGVHHQRGSTQLTEIQYHRTDMGTIIHIIDLQVVLHIIPFAHPCVISICLIIHEEHRLIPATDAYHFDIISSSRHSKATKGSRNRSSCT